MNTLQIQSQSAIQHLLAHRPRRIQSITFFGKGNPRLQAMETRAKELKISVHHDAKDRTVAEPVTANVLPFEYADWKAFRANVEKKPKSLILALDHLQDPQNFGALCRTAEGLGLDGILIPKDRSVTVTAGVYHASVGAVETIPIVQVSNLNEALRQLKENDFWILGTALSETSHPLDETPDFEKKVLVMGTELDGLSDHTQKLCDWLVEIPLKGKIQSLNVSAAGAIVMYSLLAKSST